MDLQEEILADIVSRIPIKTIVHCRCVCKTWRNILSEPYFVDLHLSRSPAALLIHRSNPPHETDVLKLGKLVEKTDHHDIHYDPLMRFDLGLGFKYSVLLLSGTVNGLICLWNYQGVGGYICNPITREYILLPDHNYDVRLDPIVTHGFGYVEASNEYKVVSLNKESNIYKSECKIYTLGTGTWRSLEHFPFLLIGEQNGIYISGNLHWLTNDQKDTPSEMVCTFDLEKELFHLTASAPLVNGMNELNRNLGMLGGCLCICDNKANSELCIWVMKDYGMKEIWIKEIVIQDNPTDLQYAGMVRSLDLLKDGTILLVSHDQFLSTYYPKNGTLHIIEGGPTDAFDARIYVPSFIRLKSFMLEKVLVF